MRRTRQVRPAAAAGQAVPAEQAVPSAVPAAEQAVRAEQAVQSVVPAAAVLAAVLTTLLVEQVGQ